MLLKDNAKTGNNLSSKVILMAEVILLVSAALFCSISIYRTRLDIRRAIWQRMLDISNCAAGSIDGDVLGAVSEANVGSDEYNDLYKKLAVFRDNSELEYIYSLKEDGNGEYIFTMDTDPDEPASYGDPVEYTDALASAGAGKSAVDEVPYSDQWGEFYSAYSPVFDSNGKVAGIIAVDFSTDWFDEQLSAQTKSTVISYIIMLLITLFIAAVLMTLTIRPFVKMHSQLLEEKVAAESANHAKSDFLANMSHEIRTPINTILGMNEMILREGRDSKEPSEEENVSDEEHITNIIGYASEVESAGNNLLAIINDILDFSKIEAGRMDLVEAPYRIRSLIGELRTMLSLKAKDKGLELMIEIDRDLPDELIGDAVRVRQILTNLLNNAIKYTDHGHVFMKVGGTAGSDGKFLLRADVEDTGIGIKKQDMQKLFDRFQRLEMERNSTVEGTGLGLVITQRLLGMMGGSITVDSKYGKGSTFTVRIPQNIVEEPGAEELGEKRPEEETIGTAARKSFTAPTARILVVDDTRTNLMVVTCLLKKTQVMVDTADSGAESVKLAAENAYDVILMDQRMPEMDGTEALHRIRETEGGACCDTPVICFTADAVVGAKDKYLEEGFSDYITKPVDGYNLEKMLLKYLPAEKVS